MPWGSPCSLRWSRREQDQPSAFTRAFIVWRPKYAGGPCARKDRTTMLARQSALTNTATTGLQQHIQAAGGIAKGFGADAHAVQHGHEEVVHRRVVRILNVAAGLDGARALACEEDRQVIVVVAVAVAQARAVDDHGVVQHRAVVLFDR